MTSTAPGRTLPLRVPVLDGECLDSWLEALARRNQISIRRLLPAFEWRPAGTRLSLDLAPDILRRAERQAGLSPGRLSTSVPGAGGHRGPGRRTGSRYCPQCLAGSGGRWMLAWKLPWAFACTTHGVLLADSCPGCGQPPRASLSRAGLNPAGTCPAPRDDGSQCETDLRAVPPEPADGRLLTAQQWITALTSRTGGDDQAGATMNDLPVIAGWMLRHADGTEIGSFGSRAEGTWRAWLAERQPARLVPPATAILTGVVAVLSMTVIRAGDQDAIRELRARLPAGPVPRSPQPPAMQPEQWQRLSAAAQGRFLRAMDPDLRPLDRVRYQSGTGRASLPERTPAQLAARARGIPQLLWPGWTVRLLPPAGGFSAVPFRQAMAAALLLPGNPVRTSSPRDGPHSRRSSLAVSFALRALAGHSPGSVPSVITCLAGYLDDHGSPIDYQRRRELIPAGVLTNEQWLRTCGRARTHPGEQQRRHLHARRYVYELLTGNDLTDPGCPLAFRSAADRSSYLAFTDTLATPLRAALHEHAAMVLDSLGISEPLTWEPPASCRESAALPGREPGDINLGAVTRMVVTGSVPPGEAARQLGTTIDHVRLALEQIPRPALEWGRSAWEWQERAELLLTREFFDREYTRGHKTLHTIEEETGIPRKHLGTRARELGIPLANAFQPKPIDPGWLREQYLTMRRSYTDIAAELGVTDVTVIAAARRHQIPSRPPGTRSFPEMIATLGDGIPADIRRAVEGTLNGWNRLHRFREAMECTTITEAARRLGAGHSALISQFKRLEEDIGAPLYHRSSPGHPLHPTDRGAALIQALDSPAVRAIAPPPGACRTTVKREQPPAVRGKGQNDEKNRRTTR